MTRSSTRPKARGEQQDFFGALDTRLQPTSQPAAADTVLASGARAARPRRAAKPEKCKLSAALGDDELTAEELAAELQEEAEARADEEENAQLSAPALLKKLQDSLYRETWFSRTQSDFSFRVPSKTLNFRTDNHLYKLQERMVRQCLHILRDERPTPQLWLEMILWLLAPPVPPRLCLMSSFQACCGAYGADYHEVREGALRWVAAPLVPADQASPLSFQGQCQQCELDPQVLRERLLRSFAPKLLEERKR